MNQVDYKASVTSNQQGKGWKEHGYTCNGVTSASALDRDYPKYFIGCEKIKRDTKSEKLMFVKNCHDLNPTQFYESAREFYK